MILENKINLLTEKINSSEFIISEMKKIGIEKLPYSQSSLKRFIDSKTMDVHYNGHYKTYVKKLNDALSKKNYGDVELEDIIKSISKYNEKIRNNAGGAFNHALFWKMLSPKKQEIPKEIKSKIIKNFGSTIEFKKQFGEIAKDRFGSGWCWLILTKGNKLKIMSTPNQDNPLMNVVKDGGFPLLGLDLWEHAYYLKYQNKRDEYIKNFWDVVNWEFVNQLYVSKLKTKLSESVKSKKIISEDVNNWIKPNGLIIPKMYDYYLSSIYPKCSPSVLTNFNQTENLSMPCWGSFKTDECITNNGIIGGKFSIDKYGGVGKWSLLNWFGGNHTVDKKIIDKYNQSQSDDELFKEWIKQNKDNTENKSFEEWVKENKKNESFEEWIEKNKEKFFSEDGEYIESLTDIISNKQKNGSLDRGNKREDITYEVLKRIPNVEILRFCNGDKRDKYDGQDFKLTLNGVIKYVQIKPLNLLNKTTDESGNTIFVYNAKNQYKFDKINLFMFVSSPREFIYFDFNPDNVIIKENDPEFKDKYTYIFNTPKKVSYDIDKIKTILLKEDDGDVNPQSKINVEPENIDDKSGIINFFKTKKEKTKFTVSQSRMRELIHSVYPNCSKVQSNVNGCIGTIETENCVTSKGIIGGKFTESNYGGESEWSLINRWDTNGKVHKKIIELYNNDSLSDEFGLEYWVLVKRNELFSNDGIYTPELAEIGRDAIIKGTKNETYAKQIIRKIYQLNPEQENVTYKIYNYCSGSINDTKLGQDIVFETDGVKYYYQVKPIKEEEIKIIIDDRGQFYRVSSYFSHQKYKMENVDVMVFVDVISDKYIMFKNDFDYIQTVKSGTYPEPYYINFYEEPISTNMTIEKLPLTSSRGEEKELLQKSKENKIKFYKERFDYFKEKLKELGYSEEINEQIQKYKHKLIKLIRE